MTRSDQPSKVGGQKPASWLPEPDEAALFLDFDGTLVEIADRPDAIHVPDRVAVLLARALIRLRGRVALISGRTVEELQHYLPGFTGPIVGSHGAEECVDGAYRLTVGIDVEQVDALHRAAERFARGAPGLLAEPKPAGVVLHFRGAPKAEAEVREFVEGLAAQHRDLTLQPAHCAYELKPRGVGKDHALSTLMATALFQKATPAYAGDDVTDEAAIKWVQDRDRGGVGIRIGAGDTIAAHRLAGPADLLDLLERWLA